MKMVMIAYNEGIESNVIDVLHAAGVHTYTHWDKLHGVGKTSGPHLGTHVWPKHNNAIMAAVEDEAVPTILSGVRQLRQSLGREGVKAFVMPLEQMT